MSTQQLLETKKKKSCYNCGGKFPHEGGRKNCLACRKKCLSCDRYNHFAKYCWSKSNKVKVEKRKAVKANCDQNASSSNDEEYNKDVIGAIDNEKGWTPIKKIKIEDREVKVLINIGSMVDVMDERTYQSKFTEKCKLPKTSSIIHVNQTSKNPTPVLPIIGKIDTCVESEERIIQVMFYMVKGDTRTEPLLSYTTAEKLKIIDIPGVVNNVQSEVSNTNTIIQENPDVFTGIGKMEGVLVNLHVNHKPNQ